MFLTETVESTEKLNIDWQALLDTIMGWCMSTGIKLLIGIVLLIICFKIINGITKRIYKKLKAKNVDETILRVCTQTIKLIFKFNN